MLTLVQVGHSIDVEIHTQAVTELRHQPSGPNCSRAAAITSGNSNRNATQIGIALQ
jgi:hypothetical protein